ncbi:hypothetical protein GCM10023185_36280 [Hymenobacter saemangeumensis]|uniref:Ankyrin repeat domain-containing protein n=1 Tax=Hymenobacter saemangeumensis TaxID=1084522 RepID=A0ABP8IPZ5_9BACT
MQTPFKLDQHPRRPRALLSEPPAGYFDQLPTRVMARLPRPEEADAPGWAWLLQLPAALRTSLAATVLLGGFAASFWLSGPTQPQPVAAVSLDAVPKTELVSYLLTSGARVESTDLALLAAAHPEMAQGFLHASDDELSEVLADQPSEDAVYF